jgi:amidohydrolase family protein
MKTPTLLATALGLLALLGGSAPASAEDKFVAIKAKTVITATGDEFSPGVIVLRNGKVEAVGPKVALPPKAVVIEAPDEVVMPGLVLAQSFTGRPRGGNSGHMTVAKELFLRPGDLERYAKAGFVAVALVSPGNGVTGQALVVRPIDGKLDDLTLHGAGYLRVTMSQLPGDKLNLRGAFKEAEQWIERIEKAKKAYEEAKKKAAAAAAAKKKAEAAKKKQGAGPKPKPTPVPGPRPRPRPVPRRAPLEGPQPEPEVEYQEGAEEPQQAPAERTREQKIADVIGHDHEDPNAGKLPAPVGIDPFAPPRPKRPSGKKLPKTFKAPKVPERTQIFMTFVKKPADGLRVLLELKKASDFLHYEDGFKERKLDPCFYLDTAGSGWRSRGQSDLFRIAPALGKAQARVLVRPILTMEPYTQTRRNIPKELLEAGCTIGFVPSKGPEGFLAEVAVLVRAGYDRTKAIQGMTLRPAELLGLGSEIGALKKGYRGDLTFLSGDPFAPGTRVTRVVLGGEEAWSEENQ